MLSVSDGSSMHVTVGTFVFSDFNPEASTLLLKKKRGQEREAF